MAAPPAPALAEVLLGEIIHRFPPDDPACLFRATAVCRAWRAFVTNADVIRRYRAFHEAPPVLGLLQNRDPAAAWGPEPPPRERVQPRFFATAALPRSIRLPNIQGDYPHVLDCRHGRVLVHTLFPLRLVVCNPITGQQQFLPAYPLLLYSCFSAAVLCAVGDCDHLHCGGGAFRVVFTATLNTSTHDQADPDDPDFTWASLYSSETGVWTDPTVIHPGPLMVDSNDVMGPSLLAGGAVYCTLDLANSRTVLRYDLGGGAALSVMNMPPLFRTRRDTFLVTVEGGGLGFAAVEENYRLRLGCIGAVEGDRPDDDDTLHHWRPHHRAQGDRLCRDVPCHLCNSKWRYPFHSRVGVRRDQRGQSQRDAQLHHYLSIRELLYSRRNGGCIRT